MKKKTLVVTGSNGFMGNKFVAEALKKGFAVIALSRAEEMQSAEDRVFSELKSNMSLEEIEQYESNLTVYDYDIIKPGLGLREGDLSDIRSRVDIVFNFVGDTNFFPKNVEKLLSTNIYGVENMIKTLCSKKIRFNHISTAYVSGFRSGNIYEHELDKGQRFKNHYEESKFLGEKKVHELCEQEGIPYHIFRPSIVIRRESIDGKSPNLNHFYSFIGLVDIMRRDVLRKEKITGNTLVHVPVRFLGKKDSTLNFVDLDYANDALLYIGTQDSRKNKTFHLVNDNPMTNDCFVKTIMRVYNISGFDIVENEDDFKNLNIREKLVKRGLANYGSYFFVNALYDDTNTKEGLHGASIKCPCFDEAYIARAVKHHI